MNDDRERQRLQRLHDEQIRSRDPGPSKIPHYDWSKGKSAPRRAPLLVELFAVFPTRVRALATGLLIGALIAIGIHIAAPHLDLLGLLAVLMFGVVSYILGVVVQSQE